MKNYCTRSASPASTGDKIKISKRELERMVETEVCSAMKKREGKLDALIDQIQQQLDQGMSSETSIKNLRTRMMAVAERAEKALTHLKETSTPSVQSSPPAFQTPTPPFLTPTPPLADTPLTDSHLELKNVRSLSETSLSIQGPSVTEFMEHTKKEFERLHAENAALKAAFEDIRERTTPSPTAVRRPPGVMEGLAKLMHIKKEPVDPQGDKYVPATVPVKRIKEEFTSPEADRKPKRIKSEAQEQPYPPLPQLPVPVNLPPEAAQYRLPPRLTVDLALITNPSPQLSVVWSLDEQDAIMPPMDTYSVFFSTERALGCGVFKEWQNMGEHQASSLPMFSLIPQCLIPPGLKICVTVVGKDRFGRYGPYSEVVCAYI